MPKLSSSSKSIRSAHVVISVRLGSISSRRALKRAFSSSSSGPLFAATRLKAAIRDDWVPLFSSTHAPNSRSFGLFTAVSWNSSAEIPRKPNTRLSCPESSPYRYSPSFPACAARALSAIRATPKIPAASLQCGLRGGRLVKSTGQKFPQSSNSTD